MFANLPNFFVICIKVMNYFSSNNDSDNVVLRNKAEVAAVVGVEDVVPAEEIPVAFESIFIQRCLSQEDHESVTYQDSVNVVEDNKRYY